MGPSRVVDDQLRFFSLGLSPTCSPPWHPTPSFEPHPSLQLLLTFSPGFWTGSGAAGLALEIKALCLGFFQGNRGRIGVVIAAYMHYSNISAR